MNKDELLEVAHARKHNNTLIVTFSDYHYKDVLLNWLASLHRLDIRNYLVISLDTKIHAFLNQQGIPSILFREQVDLSDLWEMRIEIFQLLCHNDIDFIHSDTDAVWLRNPLPDYFTTPGCDVVASQGTVWPFDILDSQGFVFCCGLFYIKSNIRTRALFDEIASDIGKTGDDQASFNRVIQRTHLKWDMYGTDSYHMHYEGRRFRCFTEPVVAYSPINKLSVALLPHHLFQRLHMPGQDAFVKHLLSEKDSESKLDMFARTGCRLPDTDDNTIEHCSLPATTANKKKRSTNKHQKNRLLVYGMQSSGASLFAYFLSQRQETLGIVDLNNHRLAPPLPDELDIVLKTVVTTRWRLQEHIDSFQPDRTILFIRNPCSNYYSLVDKVYANKSGTVDEKLKILESHFKLRDQFDLTIFYEDFITDYNGTIEKLNSIGWDSKPEHYNFPRSSRDITSFNIENSTWCKENPAAEGPKGGWGMGNIRSSSIKLALSDKPCTSAMMDKVKTLCPAIYDYYLERKDCYPVSATG